MTFRFGCAGWHVGGFRTRACVTHGHTPPLVGRRERTQGDLRSPHNGCTPFGRCRPPNYLPTAPGSRNNGMHSARGLLQPVAFLRPTAVLSRLMEASADRSRRDNNGMLPGWAYDDPYGWAHDPVETLHWFTPSVSPGRSRGMGAAHVVGAQGALTRPPCVCPGAHWGLD